MWMIKPAVQREVTINLPEILVESLGVGAEMLAQHLNLLADAGTQDPGNNPPPPPVLCRICERQITPWWFPKHSELCLQEHRAEAEVQMAQERLAEHRTHIVKVLDALETQSRQRHLPASEITNSPVIDYKGMPIGPSSTSTSGTSSSAISRSPSRSGPRDIGNASRHHSRSKSFTVRRPLARIVELVLDLCDTAAEINTPALSEARNQEKGGLRTQSPQSEGRISQVLQWQSPSASALENEAGLSALCDDTTNLATGKVDSVMAFQGILEYSERIRDEFTSLVQECIDAALAKASRIAAGESSESSSDESTSRGQNTDAEEERSQPQILDQPSDILQQRRPSALAEALRSAAVSRSVSSSPSRRVSTTMSERSSSLRECPTPRSRSRGSILNPSETRSVYPDTDTGGDSDSSLRSTARSQPTHGGSPASEAALSRAASSRERKRRSFILPRAVSSSRAQSPGRPPAPPLSPLRVAKPRIPSGAPDSSKSPLISPTLSSSEFCSPIFGPQQPHQGQQHHQHRRQSSAASSEASRAASSPHLTMTNAPQPRAAPPSIKDFEIIKPISKGAFGSVYLAKKKSTGDYYAIKALKKADMVAKNQVANVKAERAILMWQGESDFVAKLYWTFPSKDYIFLVMEYLNGGDCSSLVRALGILPEEWAKKYMAEVVLGIEHLHSREIVHRDIKPDNLLIDQKGHLKLTDFGLSRMGLIGRQKRALGSKIDHLAPDPLRQGPFARSTSMSTSRSASFDLNSNLSPGNTPALTPAFGDGGQPSYFNLSRDTPATSRDHPVRSNSGNYSDAGDSDHFHGAFSRLSIHDGHWSPTKLASHGEESHGDEPSLIDGGGLHKTTSNSSNQKLNIRPHSGSMLPPPMALFDPDDSNRRFVGTPDYLAPETINGLRQDEMSDWWSLGCILFEFLFGYPPFHAETPDRVFENILSRKIDWPEDDNEVSAEAKDMINRLTCLDPSKRLGANSGDRYRTGGEEIRNHPWLVGIDWDTVDQAEASFVPATEDPENTEYFDARGATAQDFTSEFEDQKSSPALTPSSEYLDRPHDALSKVRTQVDSMKRNLMPLHIPKHVREGGRNRRLSEPVVADDFGQFSFRNLPVLEKANKDVIQKLRAEAMHAQSKSSQQHQQQQVQQPQSQHPQAPKSATSASSPGLEASPIMTASLKRAMSTSNRSASPATNSHANSSSPSRASQPPSPLVQFSAGHHHERRKTSSSSSHSSSSLQPGFFDIPKFPPAFKQGSNASSPVRTAKSPLALEKEPYHHQAPTSAGGSPRTRSHTLGSNEGDAVREKPFSQHSKRRSQVVDISPSSSDNDETRHQKLLRVHRRRQDSRRMSHVNIGDGPVFRPLDVLVCEDHPVSRLVMEKLLEKIRCRAIVVSDGTEAMRYAMSSVKFDVIIMEFKLPQVNGEDVARMIRETKNANCLTPIVACTGYLKELQAPHHFDTLIEKPPTPSKLSDVLSRLCHWKPPPAGWTPPPVPSHPPGFHSSGLRNESLTTEESPTSTSGFPHIFSSKESSREDSMSSASVFTDVEARLEDQPTTATKPFEETARKGSGLGIAHFAPDRPDADGVSHAFAALQREDSAPAHLDTGEVRKRPSAELIEAKRKAQSKEKPTGGDWGDDEDEELGNIRARSRSPKGKTQRPHSSSKLASELMRADSSGSIVSMVQTPQPDHTLATSPPDEDLMKESAGGLDPHISATTPPEMFPRIAGDSSVEIDMDATPTPHSADPFSNAKDEKTPRPASSFGASSENPDDDTS